MILLYLLIGAFIPFLLSILAYLYLLLSFNRKKLKNYKNKHIIIYGASEGLGKALSLILSKQGVKLSIASRNESKLKKLQELCLKENSSTKCDYYITDITNEEHIIQSLNASISKNGFPSLIINCAGIAHPGYIENISLETFENDMNLNYFGNLKLLMNVIKYYRQMNIKNDLDIVCVDSVLGLIGSIGYTSYAPSKFALKGLLDSLRFELLTTNIKLHYFCPSNMLTPGFEEENKMKPQLVLDMENQAKTISAEDGAKILLSQLDKFIIVSEPDLELLKIASYFMNEWRVLDFLLLPIAALGVAFNKESFEKHILNYNKKENLNKAKKD